MPSATTATVQPSTFGWLLQHEVLPALGPLRDAARVRVTEQLAEGRSTSDNVRFLVFDDGEAPLVVRAMHRPFNPLRPWGRLRRFSQAAQMTDFVRAHGVPAPEVRRVVKGIAWRRMVQYVAIVEECVDGVELSRRDCEHVCGAMGLLGRLHGIRSARWGRPGLFAGGSRGVFARGEIVDLGDRCARAVWGKNSDGVRGRLRSLLAARTADFLGAAGDEPFALIHGDMKAANCLRRTNGGFCLIDFHHTRYSFGAMEFLDSLAHFCGGNDFAADAARAYFAEAGETAVAELRAAGNLALAMATLRRLHARKGEAPPPVESVLGLLEDGAERPLADAPNADWNAIVAFVRGRDGG